jgi:hypothetical protein
MEILLQMASSFAKENMTDGEKEDANSGLTPDKVLNCQG